MRPVHRLATLCAAVILAACSGGTGSQTQPASAAPVATTAASCTESTATTTVEASVGDNTWGPVAAKVGDVVTWSNGDGVPHRVVLDDGSCSMSSNIPGGGTKSLVFSVAGTFPFHCGVHSSMKGTIVIS